MSDRSLILDAGGVVVDVVLGEPHADVLPAGAVAVPYDDALAAQGVWMGWRQVDGTFVDPAAEAPSPVTVVAKVDFYRRCSDAEAVAIDAAFAAQPVRLRRIFDAAQTFRSDAEEWPLLVGAATQLFGAERAGELLAPAA
ncbi:hypothetical protein [Methylobacterium sp. MA0201]|uniref:hypothetical protein n=1 Tax=Methylobacterium alsaeris TaxID=3344826 RepID=UPI0037579096